MAALEIVLASSVDERGSVALPEPDADTAGATFVKTAAAVSTSLALASVREEDDERNDRTGRAGGAICRNARDPEELTTRLCGCRVAVVIDDMAGEPFDSQDMSVVCLPAGGVSDLPDKVSD